MGYEPCALPLVISDTTIPAIDTCLKTLSAARNKALAAHELAHQVMAAHTHHSFTPFKLGDKVWLEARNLKCCIVNPKFTPKWEGLFTVIKSYVNTMRLDWRLDGGMEEHMERYEKSYEKEWRMEVSYGYKMEAEGEHVE